MQIFFGTMCIECIGHCVGRLQRQRTDNDPADTGIQCIVDVAGLADAAAKLHVQVEPGDIMHDLQVIIGRRKRTIQIDDVHPGRTLVTPLPGNLQRVIAEHRFAFHPAFLQPDDVAVAQVDCGINNHKLPCRIWVRPCRLSVWHTDAIAPAISRVRTADRLNHPKLAQPARG